MTYPDFEHTILSEVTDRYAHQAEVSLTHVKKNNGLEQHGLIIYEQQFGLSPTIYLDDYYKLLCGGTPYRDICEKIIDTYESYKRPIGHIAENFSDFTWVSDHIVMRLVSRSLNKELLSDVPFVPFLDLALCFAVRIQVKSGIFGSALIHKNHADTWDTDAMELFSHAKKNAKTLLPPVVSKMEDIICDILPEFALSKSDFPLPFYIISNNERSYGAASICYHGVVKELSDELSSDLYLIPSSVHEFLAMPVIADMDIEYLNDMIRSINQSQIMPPEVLSDHTYIYHRDTDRITY